MKNKFKIGTNKEVLKEYIKETGNIGVYMCRVDILDDLQKMVEVFDNTLRETNLIVGCEISLKALSEVLKDSKSKSLLNKFSVISITLTDTEDILKKFSTAIETYKDVKIRLVSGLNTLSESNYACILDICKEYCISIYANDFLKDKDSLEDLNIIIDNEESSGLRDILNTNNILGMIKTTTNVWNYYVNYLLNRRNIHDYLVLESFKDGNTRDSVKFGIFSELLELGKFYGVSYNKIYKFTSIDYQIVYQYARKMRSEDVDLYDKYIDNGKNTKAKLIEKNKEKYALFNKAIKDLIDNPTKTIKYVCSEYGINTNILSTYITRELFVVDENLYRKYKSRK